MTRTHRLSKPFIAAAIAAATLTSAALIAQPTGEQNTETQRPAADAKPVVTVTEAGTNAKELRYQLTAGSETDFRIVNTMNIEGQQGDMPAMSQALPTISQRVLATVRSVEDDGTATINAAIKAVDVDAAPGVQPAMVPMFRQQLAPLVGVAVTYKLSNRGEVSELRLDNPAIMQTQLGQFAEQFMQNIQSAAVILPEQPVGNNGKWTIASTSEMFAIKAKQNAEFTITNINDGNATVDYTMRVNAEPQPIEDPSLPPGVEARLEAFDSAFDGRYTIDLSSPIAKGTVTSSMTIKTVINQMGDEIRMTQSVKSTVAVTDPENSDTPANAPDSNDE